MNAQFSASMQLDLVDKISGKLVQIEKNFKKLFQDIAQVMNGYESNVKKMQTTTAQAGRDMVKQLNHTKSAFGSLSQQADRSMGSVKNHVKDVAVHVNRLKQSINGIRPIRVPGAPGDPLDPSSGGGKGKGKGSWRSNTLAQQNYGLLAGVVAGIGIKDVFLEREMAGLEYMKPGDYDRQFMKKRVNPEVAKLAATYGRQYETIMETLTGLAKAGIGGKISDPEKRFQYQLKFAKNITETEIGLRTDEGLYSEYVTMLMSAYDGKKNKKTGKKFTDKDLEELALQAGRIINYVDDVASGAVTSNSLLQMLRDKIPSMAVSGLTPSEATALFATAQEGQPHVGKAREAVKQMMQVIAGNKTDKQVGILNTLHVNPTRLEKDFYVDPFTTLANLGGRVNRTQNPLGTSFSLFGERGGDVMGIVDKYKELKSLNLDIQTKDKSGYLQEKMDEEVQKTRETLGNALSRFEQSLRTFTSNLVDVATPAIIGSVDLLSTGLNALNEGMASGNPWAVAGSSAVGFGGLALGVDMLQMFIANIFGREGKSLIWGAITRIWAALFGSAGGAGLLTPIITWITGTAIPAIIAAIQAAIAGFLGLGAGWIALIVAAVVAAALLIYDICFNHGNLFVNNVLKWIKDMWNGAIAGISEFFGLLMQAFSRIDWGALLQGKFREAFANVANDTNVSVVITDNTGPGFGVTTTSNSKNTKQNTGKNNPGWTPSKNTMGWGF